ncbi:MAG TPA: hypothetical protein VH591_11285 [Ktedonobacterales bacterium]|jgi:uncharacterized membrane protein
MPSDSPPHPSSSGPELPPAESDAGVSARDITPTASAQRGRRGRHNPRITAALCYAVPYVVAGWVLLRERRNRFVRFHAAQALIFFVTIPLIQLVLFVALVIVGNLVGIGALAFVLGLLFIGAFVAVGVGALFLWLRMLADSWAGQATVFPILGPLAHRLERLLTEVRREVASSRTVRQNDMV